MSALLSAVPATWVRRLGVWGFWFFLVKGLLWLTAPVVIYKLF